MTDTRTPPFETLTDLAARVHDGMTLAVGGTLFTRMPVQLLAAVCETTPRDLHYACWGGGLPLEMLLEAGAVRKATLCFSSLDIFGQAKRFQVAIENGTLELSEWTAHAFAQALSAGKRRLPSEPFTWPAGSDLAELPTFPRSVADPISGERIGAAAALRPDVLLLHAPAADEDGNIVLVGARAMELVMVPASREVLVTVDAVVSRDELRRMPAGIVISRHFVSAIAVVPGGAAPTSSLPYYLADFDGLRAWTAAEHRTAFARDAAGDDEGEVSRLAELDAATVAAAMPKVPDDPSPATPDEWMTCWLARQYPDGSVCSVGAVSPLASASYLLAKATSAPSMTLITNGGCYIDVEPRPVLFGLGEWLDTCSALTVMGGEESYEWFYQARARLVRGRQRRPDRRVRADEQPRGRHPLAGDASGCPARVAWPTSRTCIATSSSICRVSRSSTRPSGSSSRRPPAEWQVTRTAPRRATSPVSSCSSRTSRCSAWTGQAVGSQSRRSSPRPHSTSSWNRPDSTSAPRPLDGIPVVDAPTSAELDALRRRVDPLGIRRLEFVPSRERAPLLDSTIRAEADVAARVLERPFYRSGVRSAGSR